jgi:hypothetical protein
MFDTYERQGVPDTLPLFNCKSKNVMLGLGQVASGEMK